MRHNNFDLIRLFAALQVAIQHGISHLGVETQVMAFLAYFPGVPIFFVVSGFLVSMSLDRAKSTAQYFRNRLLRIYPALWVCLLFSVAVFTAFGVRAGSAMEMSVWLVAQATVVQFYNPGFLREFGVGVINGSLWTIPVELQFYAALPLLAVVANRWRWGWILLTVAASCIMLGVRPIISADDGLVAKVVGVTLLPYLFYFLIGVLLRKVYETEPRVFAGKAMLWACAYVLWIYVAQKVGVVTIGNHLSIPSIVLLGSLSLSIAFSAPSLAARTLRHNDISYGIYIYHMPLVNLLLAAQWTGFAGLAMLVPSTLICAFLSWRWVEKPALRLKTYSVQAHGVR